jgi:hypothetical protein
MASDDDLWSSSTLHVKLALVAITIGLILLHTKRPQDHALEGIVFLLSHVIVGLRLSLAT